MAVDGLVTSQFDSNVGESLVVEQIDRIARRLDAW
jgi:hypothetical protein